jgi:hypothetical protein
MNAEQVQRMLDMISQLARRIREESTDEKIKTHATNILAGVLVIEGELECGSS